MYKSSEVHVALTSLPDAATWDEMSDRRVVPSATVATATEPPDFRLRVIIAIPAIQLDSLNRSVQVLFVNTSYSVLGSLS